MQRRTWIKSGIVEEFDSRQTGLQDLVLSKIKSYYSELYQTRSIYRYPLSLSKLARMCNRSKPMVLSAVRVLANSKADNEDQCPIFYDRISSGRNASHRPFAGLFPGGRYPLCAGRNRHNLA